MNQTYSSAKFCYKSWQVADNQNRMHLSVSYRDAMLRVLITGPEGKLCGDEDDASRLYKIKISASRTFGTYLHICTSNNICTSSYLHIRTSTRIFAHLHIKT